jgi:hypothetical protein
MDEDKTTFFLDTTSCLGYMNETFFFSYILELHLLNEELPINLYKGVAYHLC